MPLPGLSCPHVVDRLRHYPAMLLLRAAGTVAVAQDRDDVLLRLLREPSWRDPNLSNARIPAAMALHDYRIFDRDQLLSYPRFTTPRHYPISLLLREDSARCCPRSSLTTTTMRP